MNKAYRIVCNKARNCLMVVGENAKSQAKGTGNKKPLVNAVTAALLALGGSNAHANGDITITGPVTTTQTLGSGQSILVDGSGTNTGSIVVSNGSAISVLNGTSAGAINNTGTISGGYLGISGGYHGIYVYSSSTLTGGITNSGSISGRFAGISVSQSTLSGGINNSGSISGVSYGIHARQSTLTGGITNSGLISGTSVAGIFLNRSSTLTGGINNSGTISGGRYAVFVDSTSTLTGGILVTGTSAQFIGDIYAPNVDLTLASGAEFTNSNAMSLNGVIVSSRATFNLTNAASASSSLSGNINVGNGTGYFTNQGTVDVGSRGASATPTITGNYVQDAGGTFKTTVVSDTEYGQMRVTGSATLAGTAEVAVSGAATALTQGGTLGGVITADGGVTGEFSSINTTSSIYTFAGVYTATTFGLAVGSADTNAVANNSAQYGTSAATGAAGAFDQIATDPGAMAPVLDTLDGMSGQTQADAVEQTLPVVVGASSMVAAQNQIAFNRVVQARQAQIAGLSSGEAFAGNRDVWAKGFGNWANQGDLNNVAGYSVDGGGVAFGFDKQLSLKSNLGISLAYAYSSVSSNSAVAPSSVDINSYQLGLYGDYQLQPDLQLTYQLDGAINTNASTRSLSSFAGTTGVGANATGTYNSYVVHAGLGLKKFFSLNPSTRLTPEVRVDYTTVQTDAYTESGGGLLNLKVNSQTYETLYTSASLRLDHTLSNGLDISANIGVAYNALDNNAQLTSAYQGGGPAFVTNGLEISPWLYNAGVGIGGMVSKDVELNVRYDIDFSSTSYTNQMVSARVKVLF